MSAGSGPSDRRLHNPTPGTCLLGLPDDLYVVDAGGGWRLPPVVVVPLVI